MFIYVIRVFCRKLLRAQERRSTDTNFYTDSQKQAHLRVVLFRC